MRQEQVQQRSLERIEWLLKPKSNSKRNYKPPYGNLVELNTKRTLLNYIGEDILTEIVSDYLDLIETSAAVYESNGDYALGIFTSGWCRLCDQASRSLCETDDNREALESGKWHCHESCWTQASKVSIETSQPVDIECLGGLRIYAIPIWANREIVGSLNFGHGDPPLNPQKLQEIANRYKIRKKELLKCAELYESRPPFIIDIAKSRLATSARLISAMVERRQAEIKVRESEKKYRELVERANDGIVIIQDEKVKFLNRQAAEILGYTVEEVLNKSFVDYIHPDHIPEALNMYQARISGQDVHSRYETKLIGKDGQVIEVEVNSGITSYQNNPADFAFVRDITERKLMEEKIRRKSEQFEKAIESLSHPFYVIDIKNYRLVILNSATKKLYSGYKDINTCYALTHGETKPCWQKGDPCPLKEVKRTKQPVVVEHQHYDKRGNARIFELHCHPIFDKEGNIGQVIEYSFEITYRKTIEKELQEKQKLAAIGQLVAGVAHELNTPLTNIILSTEVIKDNILNSDRVLYELQGMKDQTKYCDRIVKSLLLFSRKMALSPTFFNIKSLLTEIISYPSISMKLREKRTQILIEVDDNRSLIGDRGLLLQAFQNIIINSIDAISQSQNDPMIKISLIMNEKEMEIIFTDNGRGISKENLPKIFDPFFSTKTVGHGTGLGLAIVEGIIEKHSGQIIVNSTLGEGTEFRIILPQGNEKIYD